MTARRPVLRRPDFAGPGFAGAVRRRSVAVADGGIDAVFANAGTTGAGVGFLEVSLEEWHRVMRINLDGAFKVTQPTAKIMMRQKSGRIVNIASTAALTGYAYVTAYCAAKHGVVGLTRALALEVARKDITVNAVCPGYTDTAIVRETIAADPSVST